MFTCAWVLLHVLRRTLNCKLPIELWHLGPDELPAGMIRLLEPFDVRVVDAATVLADHPARIVDGWQLKPYALMHSGFAEVLLLDADQVPVRDPSEVFDWPEYLGTGAVFWPDRIDLSPDNQIWSVCDLKPEQRPSFESGQVLIDKRRHWPALQVCLFFNEEAEHYYKMLYGDKDTFLSAWLVTRDDFTLVPHRPIVDFRCLFQRDFQGTIMFQHRTGAKWIYDGEQRKINGFVHDNDCLSALAELKKVWNGRIFHPPARSLAAQEKEEQILKSGTFVLLRAGDEDTFIDFLPGHQLGEGCDQDRQNWYVIDRDDGGVLMEISDGHLVTLRFEESGNERWFGCETVAPYRKVELRPAGDRPQSARRLIRTPAASLKDANLYLEP